MKSARAPLRLLLLLAALGSFQNAAGQWAAIKASLQKEVRVLEETPARLVLCREDSTATLVITIRKEAQTDIFGGMEARRGGNPYRVWIATENFWRKPHLAEGGGRRFFQSHFVKTLRPEAAPETLLPVPRPAETEKEPESEEPVSARPLVEQTPQEQPAIEKTAVNDTAADSLHARAASSAAGMPATAPAPARKPAKRTKKNRPARAGNPAAARPAPLTADKRQRSALPPPAAAGANLDSLYKTALLEIEKGNWPGAVAALEKIQSVQPNYRDVPELLLQERMNRDWAKNTPEPAAPRKGGKAALFTGGALAAFGAFIALIVLPMLGVILLSTDLRARFYLFRGRNAEAAQLYEKKLARHPGKTGLYAKLANAYLLLGRRDEQALKVYKMVLQLKLRTKNYDAINALVAQSYLAESKTDANMIEVLENALKAERRKLGQGPAPEKP